MRTPTNAGWALVCAAALAGAVLAFGPGEEARSAHLLLAQQEGVEITEPPSRGPARKSVAKPTCKLGAQAIPGPEPPAAPAPPPASTPAAEPPAPQAPARAIGEYQPVLHAQGAKITTCMDTIVGESAAVIDSAHTAISSWATNSPNENVFLSIIGLSYANKIAPNAAAVILAAPVGPERCAGETVQVIPFGQSCSAIQASLIKDGRTIAMLRALPVVETKSGFRNVLLPTAGGGCVMIAVGLR